MESNQYYNIQMKYMIDEYEMKNKSVDKELIENWQMQEIHKNKENLYKLVENTKICKEIINEIILEILADDTVSGSVNLHTECRVERVDNSDTNQNEPNIYPGINPFGEDYPPEWPIDFITHQSKW